MTETNGEYRDEYAHMWRMRFPNSVKQVWEPLYDKLYGDTLRTVENLGNGSVDIEQLCSLTVFDSLRDFTVSLFPVYEAERRKGKMEVTAFQSVTAIIDSILKEE